MTDQAAQNPDLPAPFPRGEYLGLNKHHDDEFFDEVLIETDGMATLHIGILPRWKESEMSGDEWRVSHLLTLSHSGQETKHTFGRMRDAMNYAPHFVYQSFPNYLRDRAPEAKLTIKRKGIILWEKAFDTFGEIAIGLPWITTIASENGDVRHFTDAEDKSFCCQPGCSSPPSILYRMKKEQVSRQSSMMIDFQYPEFQPHHRWFCKKHKRRGDCGLEDADTNYDLISDDWSGK